MITKMMEYEKYMPGDLQPEAEIQVREVRAVMLKDSQQEDHPEGVLNHSWLGPVIPNKCPGMLLWLLREHTLQTTGLQ